MSEDTFRSVRVVVDRRVAYRAGDTAYVKGQRVTVVQPLEKHTAGRAVTFYALVRLADGTEKCVSVRALSPGEK